MRTICGRLSCIPQILVSPDSLKKTQKSREIMHFMAFLMDLRGIEPLTSRLRTWRSRTSGAKRASKSLCKGHGSVIVDPKANGNNHLQVVVIDLASNLVVILGLNYSDFPNSYHRRYLAVKKTSLEDKLYPISVPMRYCASEIANSICI